jgi:mannitol/fructose-specific phosphotransferase system IIA component (Ntr-type)
LIERPSSPAQRERLGSTGIGRGLALPHGRHASLTRARGILAVCRTSVEFDSLDMEPADIVCLLLTPTDAPGGQHANRLRYLELMSRTLRDDTFCQAVRQAATTEAIAGLLNGAGVPCAATPPVPFDLRKCRLFATACAPIDRPADAGSPDGRTAAEILGHALTTPVPTARQGELLRDLFGPHPRPLAPLDPAWLASHDGAARRVAQSIYEANTFADLPILGDALEDAGCTDADLLAHLRGPGPHVRGCWAVDLARGIV